MKKTIKKIKIKILTGFHIGQGNDKLQIGGVDSAVLKDPITNLPYIPGSSIKGKIRCLLETEGGYDKGELNPEINTNFGSTTKFLSNNKTYVDSPTKIIFRDLFLTKEYEEKFNSSEITTEFKTEIVIDRTTGKAKNGGLRTIERVAPGVEFEGEILIRSEESESEDVIKMLNKGIELLNNDYLGGSGSRGYGAVKVTLN